MLHVLKENIRETTYKSFHKTLTNLRTYMPIHISILKVDVPKKTVIIYAFQNRKNTDKIYSKKEIHDFIRRFTHILSDENWTTHIRVGDYKNSKDIQDISAQWVILKMKEHNINRKQIIEDMDLDKHILSKLLNNKAGFTRWHKAAFYYYFKNLENTDYSAKLSNIKP